MANIYSMAVSDILWLGDDSTDEAETVFKFVQDMGHILDNLPADERVKAKALRAAASAVSKEITSSAVKHVLGKRRVWERIWIVQEIVVAQDISIYCGFCSMPWSSLVAFFVAYAMLRPRLMENPDELPIFETVTDLLSPAIYIQSARGSQYMAANISVLDLWCQFNHLQATDPRDKIFALMGLAQAPPLDFNADYTKPATEVFIAITGSAISQTQCLDSICIGHAEAGPVDLADITLPTWVPDFGSYSTRQTIFAIFECPHMASGNMKVLPNTTTVFSSGPEILVLFGIQLDIILRTYSGVEGGSSWSDLRSTIQELPRDMLGRQYHTGESLLVAFARTVTGDMSVGEVFFGEELPRQSEQEAKSLSRDVRSLLSLKGQFKDKLRSSLPSRLQSLLPDRLQRRERKQPKLYCCTPSFSGYRFCTTVNGFMAMIPDIAEAGDVLCVLYGSKYPHVLRKVPEKEDTYTLVGTAYVHGFMDGEVIEWRDQGKLKEQKFNLI
jgi:hypothetical protein